MFRGIARQLTAAVLSGGVVMMAWSTCASGAMTMSEMVCCAEHRGECEMAGMAESCCGTGQGQTGVGMLKPERADASFTGPGKRVASLLSPLLAVPELRPRAFAAFASHLDRAWSRSYLTRTVLRI